MKGLTRQKDTGRCVPGRGESKTVMGHCLFSRLSLPVCFKSIPLLSSVPFLLSVNVEYLIIKEVLYLI